MLSFRSVLCKEDLSPRQELGATYPHNYVRSLGNSSIGAISDGFSIKKVQIVNLKLHPVLIQFVPR